MIYFYLITVFSRLLFIICNLTVYILHLFFDDITIPGSNRSRVPLSARYASA
jgi:hypothetical protein